MMTTEPQFSVVALYKFAPMTEIEARQERLRELGEIHDAVGILLLAPEGINGTIAGSRATLERIVAEITSWPGFEAPSMKWSYAETRPFTRLKVRLKREIVTMGQPEADPNQRVGTYVAPEDWNALISRPDVVVIDTRNHYEVAIGTFDRAVDPGTKHFSEFPDWVAKNDDLGEKPAVAMFCTGGIRCEKATAYMNAQGFSEVYHLDGGILRYLETISAEDSLWRGECFVFDRRVSVGHGLAPGPYKLCSICREPFLPDGANEANEGQGGYAETDCPNCTERASARQKERAAERRRQLAREKASK